MVADGETEAAVAHSAKLVAEFGGSTQKSLMPIVRSTHSRHGLCPRKPGEDGAGGDDDPPQAQRHCPAVCYGAHQSMR